jgi:cholest-4-en-3-one 26-monooxygenase
MTTTEAINIVDPAIYEQGIPHETFRWMRNNAPVYRHEYSDGDFWAVTRYNDIIQVTRDWETFSSAKKMVNLWDLSDEACPWFFRINYSGIRSCFISLYI